MRILRRVIVAASALALVAVLALGLLLGSAHREIRGLRAALPDLEAVVSVDAASDLPIGLFAIDTARQAMPRSAVLDPDADPEPAAPYVMTHPAFVLAWPDGRLFLIDLGMDREGAVAFGALLETLSGAEPIEPLGSAAARLGGAVSRVRGAAFTHLHTDHTGGLVALCEALELDARNAAADAPIPVFQTPAQRDFGNHTTRAGRAHLEQAGCARKAALPDASLAPVPGFPGLFVVSASGHTPGSQVFVAHVRGRVGTLVWIFTGDVVNHHDAVIHDLPKPALYSLLVVPEDTERLAALRGWLATLATDPRVRIAVSHDALAPDASAVPAWPPSLPDAH